MNKVNKHCESLNLKKRDRSEMVTNERLGGSNLLKMGTQIHQNQSDLLSQRLEEKTENVVLKKQAQSRVSPSGRQPMIVEKDMPADGLEGSVLTKEKVRKLPAGGEGWDRKIKRKRSGGTIPAKTSHGDGEIRKAMHHKKSYVQASDGQTFRSESSNINGGISLDGNSVGGANHRKPPLPTGPAASPVVQWVGQRPKKMSRIRRANVVCPVTNQDELQISSEGAPVSELGSSLTSSQTTSSSLAKNDGINTQQTRRRFKIYRPTPIISRSEKLGAGDDLESRMKGRERGNGDVEEMGRDSVRTVATHMMINKKNSISNREGIRDGVPRQGRTDRSSSVSRVTALPIREKLDTSSPIMPLRGAKPASEKNESKLGRSVPKKLSDRKVNRLRKTQSGGSLDLTGEKNNDREGILAAADFARKASYLACSSPFWKRMEKVFASISVEDRDYLKQQLKSSKEVDGIISQVDVRDCNGLGYPAPKEHSPSRNLFAGAKEDTTVYQRVLSALVTEDELEGLEDFETRNRDGESILEILTQNEVDGYFCNGRMMGIQEHCNDLIKGHDRLVHSHISNFSGRSENGFDGPASREYNSCGNSLYNCYEQMGVEEDKIVLELQSLDLSLEKVPELSEEDDAINQEIIELDDELHQQVDKKTMHLNKLIDAAEKGRKLEERELEQIAMNRLVELAYQKKLATRGRTAERLGVAKVSNQAATAFKKRTLARCLRFENTGESCFTEPALQEVLLGPAPPSCFSDADTTDCIDSRRSNTSEQDSAKSEGNSLLQAASSLRNSLLNGARGRRSERERDRNSTRKSVTKAGTSERKTKTEPQQKTASVSASGSESVGTTSAGNGPLASSKDVNQSSSADPDLQLQESDPIGDLGVAADLGDNLDLSKILEFDDEGLQDDLGAMGLDIPMDDLADLNMLI